MTEKNLQTIPEIKLISEQICDVVLKRECSAISLVILFGSAVAGRLRNNSDIDIAIAGSKTFSWDLLQKFRILFSRKLHREVDLIDLHQSKGLVFYQAMTKGNVLVSKDKQLLVRFMTDTVYFAADMLPLICNALKCNARRFIHG